MKSPRIKLVSVQWQHVPAIQEYASEAAVAATCNLPHPYPEQGARQFFQHIHDPKLAGRRVTFAIERQGKFCGVCGVGRDDDEVTGEVGYWIALPFWGQNVATESTRMLINYAFRQFKLTKLRARCLEENAASRRVLEKNGFRLTRTGPEQYAKWPDPQETCFFELTKAEWRKRRGLAGLLG